MVHAEVVLQRDGRKGLGRSLDVHTLLGFDRLVEAVRVATSIHDTTCLLIDDHDLTLHDDVLVILLEEGVGLEELIDGVDTFALDSVVS